MARGAPHRAASEASGGGTCLAFLNVQEVHMNTRLFALLVGLAFLVAGVLGFIPGAVHPPHPGAPDLRVDSGYGYLLGLFPVNVLHNLVHVVVGIAGVVAYRSLPMAIRFARGLAIFYGVLAIMGLIPGLATTFGLIPIFGHDVWLHAGTAALAAYFGWVQHSTAGRVPTPHHA
jgi:hypothetical protein